MFSYEDTRLDAVLNWGEKINYLVGERALLITENLHSAILGAAYAAMFRDKLNETNAEKAREFAEKQLKVGRLLGDVPLQQRANVYIGYYWIFKREWSKAERILSEQVAVSDEESEIHKIADAALVRLNKERDSHLSYSKELEKI